MNLVFIKTFSKINNFSRSLEPGIKFLSALLWLAASMVAGVLPPALWGALPHSHGLRGTNLALQIAVSNRSLVLLLSEPLWS